MVMRFLCLVLLGLLFDVSAVSTQQPAEPGQRVEQALAPGDLIRITIWREPDMSGEFLVDEHGVVTLPMLGKRNVLNMSIPALRDTLFAQYAVQLRNPSVTITPLRRIYVLGEVTKPGLYTVDPTISLAGAMAMAGGATPTGNIDHLRVVRNGQVVLKGLSPGTSLNAVNIRSEDQVFVDRRGWLDRNSTFAASAVLSVTSLVVSLVLRR